MALEPLERWDHQCHAASLYLVRSGVLPVARVARGRAKGVSGQHSWVVVGSDCYDPRAVIVDPTLWSYAGDGPQVSFLNARDGIHVPHNGKGSIWTWGRPEPATGQVINLTPKVALSRMARSFLRELGALDHRGWTTLMQAPVAGWPAAEIVAAMDDTPDLEALVPIDLLGMLTDRNPGNLYLPSEVGA